MSLGLGGLACSSVGFAGGVYDGSDVRYRLKPPATPFAQIELDGYDVAFSARSGGTVGVSSRCENYEDVPKQALLGHLLFGTTERVRRLEETVTIDGRGALHVATDVRLDGVPVRLDVYLLTKDGCLFDFVHVSPLPPDPKAAAAFSALVRSFRLQEVK